MVSQVRMGTLTIDFQLSLRVSFGRHEILTDAISCRLPSAPPSSGAPTAPSTSQNPRRIDTADQIENRSLVVYAMGAEVQYA